ncbi:MAG: hypothetical protein AAB433_18585 [Nitrospirota bacterium]|jgi:hypothetical protein
MTFGDDIEIQNQLTVTAEIEISQYRSEGFNGTRPNAFTEKLRLSTKSFQVLPGETLKVHYNDATGGFWLLWRRLEPPGIPAASGVIDLTERARAIVIQ